MKDNVQSWINTRYCIVLLVIVAMVTATLVTSYHIVVTQNNFALTDLAGKQRALGQKILALSALLANPEHGHPESDIEGELDSAIAQMAQAHETLIAGKLLRGARLSAGLNGVYFKEPYELDRQTREFLERARTIRKAGPKEQLRYLADFTSPKFSRFLETTDLAVHRYHQASIREVSWLYYGVLAFFLGTLIALLYEIRFVFKPMEQQIRKMNREILERKQWLRQQVEERTADLAEAKERAERLLQEKTHTESMLQQQKELLTAVVENLPVALFAKDVKDDYRWIMWNAKASELFEMEKSETLGRTDYDRFPKEEADFFRSTDRQVMETGQIIEIAEEPVTTKRGTWPARTTKVPLFDAEGNPSILLGIIEDLTERRKTEMLLRDKIEAERASQAKSYFLANMSHELRTPLNSVLGMAELLETAELSEEQLKMVQIITQSSTILLEIVNDILDLSKIEADVVTLERIGFDLDALFGRIVATLQPLAESKGLALTYRCSAEHVQVMGDPARLARILTNLVSNAVKYTKEGTVAVEVESSAFGDDRVELLCRVSDTGIGIPPDKHEIIFQKFSQADVSTTRKFGGTGLGLAISKQLAELMGGRIGVQSEPGEGSVFWFSIPFDVAGELHEDFIMDGRPKMQRACGIVPASEARLLVAEDNILNQEYLRRLLRSLNIGHVEFAADGRSALQAMQSRDFDVVLMDCHMPERNGYETTQAIREMDVTAKADVPIIAMTANAMSGDRDKCLAVGMNDYVSKPFKPATLKHVLSQWLLFPAEPPAEEQPAREDASCESGPIDWTTLHGLLGRDAGEERDFAALFMRESHRILCQLEKECAGGGRWLDTAHHLKGSAASIGAQNLAVLCDRAQHCPAEDQTQRRALLGAIRQELSCIDRFLRAKSIDWDTIVAVDNNATKLQSFLGTSLPSTATEH